MSSLAYSIVDAFASAPFTGNPAAVVIFPSPAALRSDATLQKIAAEFNLSETAFLVQKPTEPTSPSVLTFSLRWFTPVAEVPLCGHATLASARIIFSNPESAAVDTINFETLSGVLVARKVADSGKIEIALPASTMSPATPEELLGVAGVVSEAFGVPVTIKSVQHAGFFMLVHIDPAIDLEGATLNLNSFTKLTSARGIILTSERPTAISPGAAFISRVFAPAVGIPEDPVTGSAYCVLAPYWDVVLGGAAGAAIMARQVSPRGGDLTLIWDREAKMVRMQGDAVVTARGEMYA